MIKKQYCRGQEGYFNNFIEDNPPYNMIENELKKYNATLAKSKNRFYKMNVKWHDQDMYILFVMRYA